MRINRLVNAVGLLVAAGFPAGAAERPLVVELFTSQGCSSCPPAEALLDELGRDRPDVLPLALHVTYWDNGSWRDPFSLAAATERQRSYEPRLGRSALFTPQLVVDGAVDAVGGDRATVARALAAMTGRMVTAAPMRLTRDGAGLALDVGAGAGKGTVWLVGFDHAQRTSVRGGENAGRVLTETNIVRELAPVGTWGGQPLALRRPAPTGEDFAALLQAEDGRIVGAARLAPVAR